MPIILKIMLAYLGNPYSEVQSVILEVLCVAGWVMTELRVGYKHNVYSKWVHQLLLCLHFQYLQSQCDGFYLLVDSAVQKSNFL